MGRNGAERLAMRRRRRNIQSSTQDKTAVWNYSKGGILIPGENKLVYPLGVSLNRHATLAQRTKAFFPLGTEIAKNELVAFHKAHAEYLRHSKREKKARRMDFSRGMELASNSDQMFENFSRARSDALKNSEYFLKLSSARQRAIRKMLVKAGILVEMPIEEMSEKVTQRDGKSHSRLSDLFERRGFVRLVEDGTGKRPKAVNVKDISDAMAQMVKIMTKMHALGVTHNHPHLGNWAINSDGHVKILQLSRARLLKKRPRNKSQFIQIFAEDFYYTAWVLTELQLYLERPSETYYYRQGASIIVMNNIQRLLDEHQKTMSIFGTKPNDIWSKF
jgi:hypothetical protein